VVTLHIPGANFQKEYSSFVFLEFRNEADAIKFQKENQNLKVLRSDDIPRFLFSRSQYTHYKVASQDDTRSNVLKYLGTSQQIKLQGVDSMLPPSVPSSLQEAISAFKEKIQSPREDPAEGRTIHEGKLLFNEASRNLVLTNGCEIQLAIKGDISAARFDYYPLSPEDEVFLRISDDDLLFLCGAIDPSTLSPKRVPIVSAFFHTVTLREGGIIQKYLLAFHAIKQLLKAAISQYQQLEQEFADLEKDTVVGGTSATPSLGGGNACLFEVHRMLSVLMRLED